MRSRPFSSSKPWVKSAPAAIATAECPRPTCFFQSGASAPSELQPRSGETLVPSAPRQAGQLGPVERSWASGARARASTSATSCATALLLRVLRGFPGDPVFRRRALGALRAPDLGHHGQGRLEGRARVARDEELARAPPAGDVLEDEAGRELLAALHEEAPRGNALARQEPGLGEEHAPPAHRDDAARLPRRGLDPLEDQLVLPGPEAVGHDQDV